MKRTIFTLLFMVLLTSTLTDVSAQLIKNNFMDGIQIGMSIEKGTYVTPEDGILANQWNLYDRELVSGFPPAPGQSPVAVAPLTYPGYIESGKGNALKLEKIIGGGRTTTYSLTDGDEYKLKPYYISFLINVDASTTSDRIGVIGFSGGYAGGFIRGVMTVTSFIPGTSYKLGISDINGGGTLMPPVCKYGETYLVVLKYDLETQETCGFINPTVSSTEPVPTAKIVKRDNFAALNYVRGISVFQRADFVATIGSIRFAESWEGALMLNTSVDSNVADYGKVIAEQYFNTLGVQVTNPVEKNIYIRVSTYENGRKVSQKIVYTKSNNSI